MKRVLVVSGFDPFNQAGYGLDVITMSQLNVVPVGIITCQTVQTPHSVHYIKAIEPKVVSDQLTHILKETTIHAVKIGMVYSLNLMKIFYDQLCDLNIPIIIDPIFKSTSGFNFVAPNALNFFKNKFLSLATMLTPNIPEAMWLTGETQFQDIRNLLVMLHKIYNCSVIIKGGHSLVESKNIDDWFYDGKEANLTRHSKSILTNTHGSGCLYSSILAAYKAKSLSDLTAFKNTSTLMDHLFHHPNPSGTLNPPIRKRINKFI